MNNEPPSGKRIVGKGKYAQVQAAQAGLSLLGGCLLFAVLLSALFLVYCFFMLVLSPKDTKYILLSIVMILPVIVFGSLWGIKSLLKAIKTEPGVPLTRANTADLSAPDSLVRASSPPVQAQETVLLRASKETQEKHEEQLLRATVGGQE